VAESFSVGRALVTGTLTVGVLGSGPTPAVVRANGLLIHMLGVGVPAALVAARTAP
jgi:hypothetical protein